MLFLFCSSCFFVCNIRANDENGPGTDIPGPFIGQILSKWSKIDSEALKLRFDSIFRASLFVKFAEIHYAFFAINGLNNFFP